MTNKELSLIVARLDCGSQQASAFFVTPTLAITANHSLIDHLDDPSQPILLHVPGLHVPVSAKLHAICPPATADIAFLQTAEPLAPEYILPLRAEHLSRGVRWRTYGYPLARDFDGAFLEGSVSGAPTTRSVPRDVDLACDKFRDFSDYRGFSGAPVVKDGQVAAVLLEAVDGGLTAISVFKLRHHLDAAGIAHASVQSIGGAPKWLQPELQQAVPNLRTFQAIEEAIHDSRSGYIVVSGVPGSGKTLVSGGFTASDIRTRVLGRYFCDIKGALALPTQYNREAGTFADWIAGETALLSNSAIASSLEKDVRGCMRVVHENLQILANDCRSRGLVGVLFLDDAFPPSDVPPTSLLHTLPSALPPGLRVVLSVSNSELVRLSLPDLEVASFVPVAPLEQYDCEVVIRRRLGAKIADSLLLDLVRASGGNPLLLTYIIREIEQNVRDGHPALIDIPSLNTPDLDAFYDRQWRRVASNKAAGWILGTVARLRGPVPIDVLSGMMPRDLRLEFLQTWAIIRHLLREDESAIGCYHASFRDFVLRQTRASNELFHDELASYCINNGARSYAKMNLVYHHLEGGEGSESRASSLCTQEWADENAGLCVPPTYILSDIDRLLERAAGHGDLTDLVRLLLLSSRVRFRYSVLFSELATDLSFVALALRGPQNALRLVLERQQLSENPQAIVRLLRRLVLGGNVDAALELYQAIRRRWVRQRESGSGAIEDIANHFEALAIIYPLLGTLRESELINHTLFLNRVIAANPAMIEHASLLRAQMLAIPCAEALFSLGNVTFAQDGSPKERCAILAFILNRAEVLRAEHPDFEVPAPNRTDGGPTAVVVDARSCESGAGCEGVVDVKASSEAIVEPTSEADTNGDSNPAAAPGDAEIGACPRLTRLTLDQAVEELERLYRESGVIEGGEAAVLSALCRHRRDTSLVARLGSAILGKPKRLSLRRSGGVDADFDTIRLVHSAACIAGYTGTRIDPVILQKVIRHPWEERFWSAIEWVGYAQGRWRALRRDGVQPPPLLREISRELFPLIVFRLIERTTWNDTYHIPENVLPFVLRCTAELVVEFEPSSADEFVSMLTPHFSDQLGVYTEGFRATLRSIANSLITLQATFNASRSVRLALFEHIRTCVSNRIERVLELLGCADAFAVLGDTGTAERAFRRAIESSLGPTWYKEDQFSLLLDTVESGQDNTLLSEQWKHVVQVLELASGELTFQRYVRYEKHRLISLLSAANFYNEANALYLHYLHPSSSVQRARILRAHVDRSDTLSGLRFGAPEVDEQAASLALLNGLKKMSPLKRWAIVELFIVGDDRYFEDFAVELCELLASKQNSQICTRVLRCLRVDFQPDKRGEFLRAVVKADVGRNAEHLVEQAVNLGIVSKSDLTPPLQEAPDFVNRQRSAPNPTEEDDNDFRLPGIFGGAASRRTLEECGDAARERLAKGDEDAARSYVQKGLLAAQADGWGIWSEKSPAWPLLCLLVQEMGDLDKVLRSLRPVILAEQHATRWQIAQVLIKVANASLGASARHNLLGVVSEHIRFILRPEAESVTVSDETDSLIVAEEHSVDGGTDDLLMQLLEHPNPHMRCRVASVVYWLASSGSLPISAIFKRIVSADVGYGRELAAGILHALALNIPEILEDFAREAGSLSQMLSDLNVAVRHSAAAILRIGQAAGHSLHSSAAFTDIEPSSTGERPQEKLLDWEWSADAEWILCCADGDAREHAKQTLVEVCGDHPPAELRKLWEIRRAGFGLSEGVTASPWEREAALRAVGEVGDVARRRRLAESFMYNPLWPEADLQIDRGPVAPDIFARLKKGDYKNAFVLDGKTILHCHEISLDLETGKVFDVEISGFLVSALYFDGSIDFEKLFETRSVFESATAAPALGILASVNEPAVAHYSDRFRIGGSLTPAIPSQFLLNITNLPVEAFELVGWQNGRIWSPVGAGPVCSRGSLTLTMRDSLKVSGSGFVMAWAVVVNDDLRMLVDPTRAKVYES